MLAEAFQNIRRFVDRLEIAFKIKDGGVLALFPNTSPIEPTLKRFVLRSEAITT